ncbi:MAG: alpha/beta hydrolase [Alphaproteobacteria bacterium]|nr:alpha/beta hydrolase [Alphaproteobacteria bacterium]
MKMLLPLAVTLLAASAAAVPLPPAPVIGPDKDVDGRPLPFGRQPRLPAETPAGSGRFKAVMATADALPAHVIYHPANLARAGKLPVVAWGNGACINAGNRFRYFLTEIASHGYLVLANGVMGNPALEVGPQENPPVRPPGSPPPPPPPPRDPNAPPTPNQLRAPGTTTPQQLIESIDWAIAENARPGSPLFGRIDTGRIAVMGQSCGGVQTLRVAGDPRISTIMVWNSGVGMIPGNPANPAAVLDSIHTPVAFIHGDRNNDVAFYASEANARALARVPVFQAWQDGMTHLGTYGQANGGFYGKIAVAWLDWQLKGNGKAGRMFTGPDCALCTDSSWHVFKARID